MPTPVRRRERFLRNILRPAGSSCLALVRNVDWSTPSMVAGLNPCSLLWPGVRCVRLFGVGLVSPRLSFVSCLAVALGAVIRAFWILAANSWMQTPAGFRLASAGNWFERVSWMNAIFTPSFPYRYVHMVTAACIPGCIHRDRGLRLLSLTAATRRIRTHWAVDRLMGGTGFGASTGSIWGPARTQFLSIPAGQGRRDGRRLADPPRPTPHAVCQAGRRGRAQQV
jgi:hypothetical protein